MSALVSETHCKDNKTQPKTKKNGWLIMAAIMAPMLGAFFIFKTGIGIPTATVNKGDLLRPATSVTDLELLDRQGNHTKLLDGERAWRMVIVADDRCAEVCRQQLYLTRQVHVRLGEKAIRVERLFLNTGASLSEEFQSFLTQEHPRLKSYQIDASQWRNNFEGTSIANHSLDGSHVYYVDQEGYAMMSYDAKHAGADLLADIKRLLKYSYED